MFNDIFIIGGARGIGRWFAEKVFYKSIKNINILDLSFPSDPPFKQGIATHLISYDANSITGLPQIPDNAIIIISLPMSELKKASQQLFKYFPHDCLIIDLSSEKTTSLSILDQESPCCHSIVGLHPLFGPTFSYTAGLNISISRLNSSDSRHMWLQSFLKEKGFLIKLATEKEHDGAMLYVQVLTHYTLLTFFDVLSRSPYDLSKLFEYRTPPFLLLTALAGRLLRGTPLTYVNIQKQENADTIRDAFLASAAEINTMFSSDRNITDGVEIIKKIADPYAGHQIAECKALSDKATDSLFEFERRLHELKGKTGVCCFRRLDNNMVIIGCVDEVLHDRIRIEVRIKEVSDFNGNVKVALYVTEDDNRTYKRLGIALGSSKYLYLLKRNLRILSEADMNEWLKDNLLMIKMDINVNSPRQYSERFYEKWLPKFISGLSHVEYKDSFRRRGQPEAVRLTIVFDPRIGLLRMKSTIETFLQEMSGDIIIS